MLNLEKACQRVWGGGEMVRAEDILSRRRLQKQKVCIQSQLNIYFLYFCCNTTYNVSWKKKSEFFVSNHNIPDWNQLLFPQQLHYTMLHVRGGSMCSLNSSLQQLQIKIHLRVIILLVENAPLIQLIFAYFKGEKQHDRPTLTTCVRASVKLHLVHGGCGI